MSVDCHQCGGSIPDGTLRCPECGVSPRRLRTAAFRFTTGEVIDNRYEVLSRIPGGGMGELYKVRHLHLHDVRAIKLLRADQLGDDTYRQRFLREARIAASIKHPNVALMHDFATLPDKTFYMVEEFIDGTTLAKSLRAGRRFSLNEIVEIAKQVLLGLGAIHERGIIHRDISPDNIMLADAPEGRIRAKIIDLGIARSVDPSEAHSLTSAGLFIGKPHYASPEQMRLIEDDTPIDHRTDLYSLGVVLYEVVSGRVPFEASTPFEYLLKQLAGDAAAIDRSVADLVPPDLENFIVKLLRAKREDRYQSTVEALLALSKLRLGAATIQDVPIGEGEAAYPVSPPSKKRRQTAEVPIEQLRKLIEQDRTESGRAPVRLFVGPTEPEPTEVDDMDDSRKVTIVQLNPVYPTQDVPKPKMGVEETERTPLPSPDDNEEPVAFVPEIPVPEPQAQATPSIAAEPLPHQPLQRRRHGQNPFVWFAAGIVFVTIVSVGGYLVFRWLDARFGEAGVEPPVTSTAQSAVTFEPEQTPEEAVTTDTDTANASHPDNALQQSPAVPEIPVETRPPAPVKSTPPPPVVAPTEVARRTETPRKESSPPPAAATATTAADVEEPEPPPVASEATTTSTEASDAPVVLPGSTDDVREGDLVAPGPGVVAPVVTRTVEPIYPPLSASMGHEGVAMFSVLVAPDGKPEVVRLIVSSGSEPLDKSAEDAARQTLFKPATKNGIKVRMWKTLRFEFKKTKGF